MREIFLRQKKEQKQIKYDVSINKKSTLLLNGILIKLLPSLQHNVDKNGLFIARIIFVHCLSFHLYSNEHSNKLFDIRGIWESTINVTFFRSICFIYSDWLRPSFQETKAFFLFIYKLYEQKFKQNEHFNETNPTSLHHIKQSTQSIWLRQNRTVKLF